MVPGRRVRDVPAGHDLISQGEHGRDAISVLDGWLFLYELLEDGRRQILRFALPGDVVNLPGPVRPVLYSIQALTDARVCLIPHEELHRQLEQGHGQAAHMLYMTLREEMMSFGHLTSLGRRSARERLAYLLLELYCRVRLGFPVPGADDVLDLPLTQSHIGDALGLTAVHVNRTLRALQREGVIAYTHRRLRIVDPNRLASMARFDRAVIKAWLRAAD